jgi:uncharacterized membrane protein YccC
MWWNTSQRDSSGYTLLCMQLLNKWIAGLRSLHWKRGVRAGLAVLAAMVVCQYLGQPMGWAALGGFEAILVDNGGPYRSRLTTMLTLLVGGAIACIVGSLAVQPLWLAVLVTSLFCFAVTFARVLTNQLASTSVIILVLYFAGYGGMTHTLSGACWNALSFVLGGLWAATLSLVLWPLDPFRPARLAVAGCYARLAEFTSGVHLTEPDSAERRAERQRMHELQRNMRISMEAARTAIGSTGARITSRTIRARSLTVLLETADILFAGTIRWTELFEGAADRESQTEIAETLQWLGRVERVISNALMQRPPDGGDSFAPEGSHSIEHIRKREALLEAQSPSEGSLMQRLVQDERDALLNVVVAFEAVRSLWTGAEPRSAPASGSAARRTLLAKQESLPVAGTGWRAIVDAARANWTLRSTMMRHALRILVVSAVDVLLMRVVHVTHGAWLAMTSIIVLQPSGTGTVRRGVQRVVGTIAGGVLAAIFVAAVPSQAGLIAVITVTSIFTLATYAVNYGWYAFFLTPTFVLLALPHLRDWHFAGVRMGTTLLGAIVAVAALRLLWPEQERAHLERLLAQGAIADASYIRAMIRYWQILDSEASEESRIRADRSVLAPARRACGLALNDAEEMLDRLVLEPRVGQSKRWEEALTFATYLRRMTRAISTLAAVGSYDGTTILRLEAVMTRLEVIRAALLEGSPLKPAPAGSATSPIENENDPVEYQIRRIESQVGVLERTAVQMIQR